MELLVGMYGELIATLTLALAAMPLLKNAKILKAALYPVFMTEKKRENAANFWNVTETEASK
ncbi:hypothetical protein [Sulfitobacter undariae]|nr:hypothetical protein [Sulfitobacter undariae]